MHAKKKLTKMLYGISLALQTQFPHVLILYALAKQGLAKPLSDNIKDWGHQHPYTSLLLSGSLTG
jgi:hypothetical protein